jgi:hypothetical protein
MITTTPASGETVLFAAKDFTGPAISTFETSIAVLPRPTEGHSVLCLGAQFLRAQHLALEARARNIRLMCLKKLLTSLSFW